MTSEQLMQLDGRTASQDVTQCEPNGQLLRTSHQSPNAAAVLNTSRILINKLYAFPIRRS